MIIENGNLQRLMKEVADKIDALLLLTVNQQNEINRLQYENKQLMDNHTKIFTQITVYKDELEEIKRTLHNNTLLNTQK